MFSHDRFTYYYASAADEEGDRSYREGLMHPISPDAYPEGAWVSLSGTVAEVDGREFMLRHGRTSIQVDTDELEYNPLDDVGHQQVDPGDRVTVVGRIDDQLFERREIVAESVYSAVTRP